MCIVNKQHLQPYALHSAMMAHSIADTITIGSQSGGGGGGGTSTRSSSCSSQSFSRFHKHLVSNKRGMAGDSSGDGDGDGDGGCGHCGAHTTQKECDENIIDWLVVCVTQHCRGESRVSSSMSCNDNDNHREEVDGSAEVKKVVAEVVKVEVTVKLWFPPSVAVVVVAEVEVVDVILRTVWISMMMMMMMMTWTMNKMMMTSVRRD